MILRKPQSVELTNNYFIKTVSNVIFNLNLLDHTVVNLVILGNCNGHFKFSHLDPQACL